MTQYTHNNGTLDFIAIGNGDTQIIWAHGWGQDRTALQHLAHKMGAHFENLLIDFPGFGQAPLPPESWGVSEYADLVANWLVNHPAKKRIWVGHSFGCRVGIHVAARYPHLVSGMVLIAAAGLKYRQPFIKRLYTWLKVRTYKFLKLLTHVGLSKNWLQSKFGSADYRSAGAMRPVFVRVVTEDLSDIATKVDCPVILIHGEHDTATPPDFAYRYAKLMPHAKPYIVGGFNHFTILTDGQHQTLNLMTDFITEVTR